MLRGPLEEDSVLRRAVKEDFVLQAFRRGFCATRAFGSGFCAMRACRREICATRCARVFFFQATDTGRRQRLFEPQAIYPQNFFIFLAFGPLLRASTNMPPHERRAPSPFVERTSRVAPRLPSFGSKNVHVYTASRERGTSTHGGPAPGRCWFGHALLAGIQTLW